MDDALNLKIDEAMTGICDSCASVQWLSALRIADHLKRGGVIPNESQDSVLLGLKSIANKDADSEAHLFACISLMLLGESEAESFLRDYLNHESETFRTNASHALAINKG